MAAIDQFSEYSLGYESPAVGGEEVTPSDDNDLTQVTRAIWVSGAGVLEVIMLDGSQLTFSGIQAGTLLPIRVTRVLESTSATGIVAVW